ncbi:MAG: hypothetical protein KDB07_01370, partial [Planctomycetes bacterium]|nr:hypothetical protein [Planctomycetota bacterium]
FDVFTDAKGKPTGISILFHTVGVGTRLMAKWQEGQRVSINGPLGQAYPEPADKGESPDTVIMVGGGIGLAPFLLQAKRWLDKSPERDLVLIAGGRAERDLRYMSLFQPSVAKGLNLILTTNDGSLGIKGMVTDPLQGELESLRAAGRNATIYTCGPTPMMVAVAQMASRFETPCIASLENVMACGYGVCNGCVTLVNDPSVEGGQRFAKTCIEGPAFDAEALDWQLA